MEYHTQYQVHIREHQQKVQSQYMQAAKAQPAHFQRTARSYRKEPVITVFTDWRHTITVHYDATSLHQWFRERNDQAPRAVTVLAHLSGHSEDWVLWLEHVLFKLQVLPG